MYKIVRALSAICLSVNAMCSSTGTSNAAELNVLYSASNLMAPLQESFKNDFESMHNGDRVSLEPALEYNDALAIALRQSFIGALHDVGFYGISDICLLADRGIAKPLDALIENDPEWPSLGMPENALDVTKCNGVRYGIPFSASYMVVIFNKELVAAAGGDPNKLPTTWPEILELAKRIKSKSGGIALNYEGSSSWSFMTLVLSRGGAILTPDGKDIGFESAEGLEALQILADVGTVRGHVDMTKAQARQAFLSGTLGILVDSSSGLADYKKATKGRFELGIVPFPVSKLGKVPASGIAAALQASSDNKVKLAWDYMKYAVSVDAQTLVGKLTGFQPFNQVAITSADKLAEYYSQNPELSVAAESVKNATAWPSFPGPNGLKIHRLITNYLQKVYTGAMPPDAALSSMASETRALLK